MSKTSAAVKNRWAAANYDRITVMTKKGDKDVIKACADRAGKSLNAYIVDAVFAAMRADAENSGT